jgi:hypothetical protein
MYIGREDQKVSRQLAVFKKHLQDFENHLADFMGRDLYQPRKLDKRIVIRAVDVVYASGDGRSPHGGTVAYHLPNRGRAVAMGLYKKILLINHMRLFIPLMQKRAKVALIKEQVPLVTEWSDIMNTTFHEFAHGFGAHEDLRIKNVKGKISTVAKSLGPYETLLEELKADVASQWFVPYLVQRGLMEDKEVNSRYATAVMHLFGLLQYSLKGTYPQMAAIELGNLMEQGALSFDKKTGLFQINFDRYHGAVESLLKRVTTFN